MTNKLKKWAKTKHFKRRANGLLDIANHNDAAHKREITEQKDLVTAYTKSLTEKDNWMKLPVDADGKVIHVGDRLTCDFYDGKIITVLGFGVSNNGDQGIFAYNDDEYCWFNTSFFHHSEPTIVEDVLWDFTRDWCNSACTGDMTNAARDVARTNVIAEYATKLQLKEN